MSKEKAAKVGVAILGAGGRGRGVVKNLLRDSKGDVEVVSVFDPDRKEAERSLAHWGFKDALICSGYEEAVDAPGVDWTMVFSPNAFHKEQIIYSFKSGKNVFSEKPLATTIDDCKAIHKTHAESGAIFATGFVLRYSPLYRKVKEILDSGILGRVLSIDGNENIAPAHGGYIMRNWRRHRKYSGPHILEKCCHDLDLINWFCASIPSRAASFGSRDMFIPENEHLRKKYGDKAFMAWEDPHAVESPFTSDKDIMDNQVGILEYRNGIKVMFQATMSNPIPERRMYFSCTEGTMIAELYSGELKYRRFGDEGCTVVNFHGDGHGGGDDYIMKELHLSMTAGQPPKCGGDEGLESAVTALALDESARTGKIVDIEPVWEKLGR